MINKINALLKEVENWKHYALNTSAKRVKYPC